MITFGIYPFWHSEDSFRIGALGAARLMTCALEPTGMGHDIIYIGYQSMVIPVGRVGIKFYIGKSYLRNPVWN